MSRSTRKSWSGRASNPGSRRRRGQSLLEYATLAMVLAAVLISMAVYTKRAFNGRLRQGADGLGEQYDPRHTTSSITTSMNSSSTTTSHLTKNRPLADGSVADVMVSETVLHGETTSRNGRENIGALGNNLWE